MKIIDKCFYLVATLYRLFREKKLSIPHFRAITTIVFTAFLLLCFVGLTLNISSDWIAPWSSSDTRSNQWLYAGGYFTLLLALAGTIFSKEKISKIQVEERSVTKLKKYLPIFFFSMILILALLLIRRGVQIGTIKI